MTRSGMEGVALDRRVSPVLVGREEIQTITKALRAAVHSRDAARCICRHANRARGEGGVMDKCYRCNEVISMCPCDESTYTADDEISRLRAELETERMRLVACSVIALANTPESAASARDMHPDYQSPYCDDVARAVDREIALRAELDSMTASRKAAAAWGELWRVRCARAVDELAVARAELAECKDLLRIASDFVERLPGHEGRTAFTDRIDAALAAKEE